MSRRQTRKNETEERDWEWDSIGLDVGSSGFKDGSTGSEEGKEPEEDMAASQSNEENENVEKLMKCMVCGARISVTSDQ